MLAFSHNNILRAQIISCEEADQNSQNLSGVITPHKFNLLYIELSSFGQYFVFIF